MPLPLRTQIKRPAKSPAAPQLMPICLHHSRRPCPWPLRVALFITRACLLARTDVSELKLDKGIEIDFHQGKVPAPPLAPLILTPA